MPLRRTIVSSLLAVFLIVFAAAAQAAVMPAKSLNELVHDADVICTCSVLEQHSQWDPEQNMIITIVTLQVEERLKGGGGDQIQVEALGGIVGDKGLKVTGAPVFEQGERAVLFLKSAGENRHHVVGWAQGKFTIRTDPTTGEERIERNLKGVHLTAPEQAPPATLGQLKSAIGALLAPPAQPQPAP
ncbi:MAG: hypothetical protein AB1515_08445 [Nitrospirota bacterium]